MNIVAVIVTYNRKELLLECVNAIISQSKQVNNIIIIDNNSTDNTFEYMSENKVLENSKIIYKKLRKNIGGAGGFYEGLKECQKYSPDWVWIMDDDTIPTSTCLEKLIDATDIVDEKISYLASSIYGSNGEFMNVPTVNIDSNENKYPDWYKYLKYGIIKIKEATFVSLLVNADAINKVGYPVKNYFIWGDDTEYTLRLNKYYGNSFMVGESIAIHKRNIAKRLSIIEEENKNRINFYYYMIRNNLINLETYYGKKKMTIFLIKKQIESLKVFFSKNCKYKIKKFLVIHRGILAYILGRYNKSSFKNRLDKNVKYNI